MGKFEKFSVVPEGNEQVSSKAEQMRKLDEKTLGFDNAIRKVAKSFGVLMKPSSFESLEGEDYSEFIRKVDDLVKFKDANGYVKKAIKANRSTLVGAFKEAAAGNVEAAIAQVDELQVLAKLAVQFDDFKSLFEKNAMMDFGLMRELVGSEEAMAELYVDLLTLSKGELNFDALASRLKSVTNSDEFEEWVVSAAKPFKSVDDLKIFIATALAQKDYGFEEMKNDRLYVEKGQEIKRDTEKHLTAVQNAQSEIARMREKYTKNGLFFSNLQVHKNGPNNFKKFYESELEIASAELIIARKGLELAEYAQKTGAVSDVEVSIIKAEVDKKKADYDKIKGITSIDKYFDYKKAVEGGVWNRGAFDFGIKQIEERRARLTELLKANTLRVNNNAYFGGMDIRQAMEKPELKNEVAVARALLRKSFDLDSEIQQLSLREKLIKRKFDSSEESAEVKSVMPEAHKEMLRYLEGTKVLKENIEHGTASLILQDLDDKLGDKLEGVAKSTVESRNSIVDYLRNAEKYGVLRGGKNKGFDVGREIVANHLNVVSKGRDEIFALHAELQLLKNSDDLLLGENAKMKEVRNEVLDLYIAELERMLNVGQFSLASIAKIQEIDRKIIEAKDDLLYGPLKQLILFTALMGIAVMPIGGFGLSGALAGLAARSRLGSAISALANIGGSSAKLALAQMTAPFIAETLVPVGTDVTKNVDFSVSGFLENWKSSFLHMAPISAVGMGLRGVLGHRAAQAGFSYQQLNEAGMTFISKVRNTFVPTPKSLKSNTFVVESMEELSEEAIGMIGGEGAQKAFEVMSVISGDRVNINLDFDLSTKLTGLSVRADLEKGGLYYDGRDFDKFKAKLRESLSEFGDGVKITEESTGVVAIQFEGEASGVEIFSNQTELSTSRLVFDIVDPSKFDRSILELERASELLIDPESVVDIYFLLPPLKRINFIETVMRKAKPEQQAVIYEKIESMDVRDVPTTMLPDLGLESEVEGNPLRWMRDHSLRVRQALMAVFVSFSLAGGISSINQSRPNKETVTVVDRSFEGIVDAKTELDIKSSLKQFAEMSQSEIATKLYEGGVISKEQSAEMMRQYDELSAEMQQYTRVLPLEIDGSVEFAFAFNNEKFKQQNSGLDLFAMMERAGITPDMSQEQKMELMNKEAEKLPPELQKAYAGCVDMGMDLIGWGVEKAVDGTLWILGIVTGGILVFNRKRKKDKANEISNTENEQAKIGNFEKKIPEGFHEIVNLGTPAQTEAVIKAVETFIPGQVKEIQNIYESLRVLLLSSENPDSAKLAIEDLIEVEIFKRLLSEIGESHPEYTALEKMLSEQREKDQIIFGVTFDKSSRPRAREYVKSALEIILGYKPSKELVAVNLNSVLSKEGSAVKNSNILKARAFSKMNTAIDARQKLFNELRHEGVTVPDGAEIIVQRRLRRNKVMTFDQQIEAFPISTLKAESIDNGFDVLFSEAQKYEQEYKKALEDIKKMEKKDIALERAGSLWRNKGKIVKALGVLAASAIAIGMCVGSEEEEAEGEDTQKKIDDANYDSDMAEARSQLDALGLRSGKDKEQKVPANVTEYDELSQEFTSEELDKLEEVMFATNDIKVFRKNMAILGANERRAWFGDPAIIDRLNYHISSMSKANKEDFKIPSDLPEDQLTPAIIQAVDFIFFDGAFNRIYRENSEGVGDPNGKKKSSQSSDVPAENKPNQEEVKKWDMNSL